MSNANDVGMTDAAPMTTLPIATTTGNGKDAVVAGGSADDEKKTDLKQMLLCNPEQNGRAVRQKTMPTGVQVVICPGTDKEKTVTSFNGKSEAENIKWVAVIEVKGNGTKQYICVRCGHEYVGKVGKVVESESAHR